jgi:hypothetical protein
MGWQYNSTKLYFCLNVYPYHTAHTKQQNTTSKKKNINMKWPSIRPYPSKFQWYRIALFFKKKYFLSSVHIANISTTTLLYYEGWVFGEKYLSTITLMVMVHRTRKLVVACGIFSLAPAIWDGRRWRTDRTRTLFFVVAHLSIDAVPPSPCARRQGFAGFATRIPGARATKTVNNRWAL